MNRFKLTIGDWSGDGHSKDIMFVYESNYTVKELQDAYKNSCKLTGVQFNGNENYTGIEYSYQDENKYEIATNYQRCYASKAQYKKLLSHGIDLENYVSERIYKEGDKYYNEEDYANLCEPEMFAKLILDFIKLSLPKDASFEEAFYKNSELKTISSLNGWWNKELNCQFGYGLFD